MVNSYTIADLDQRLLPSPRMPVLFIGHGNPMHAISDNEFTRTWRQVGQDLPQAQAIVVISAHWLTPGQTHITDAPKNPVIYDFGGFPDALSQVRTTRSEILRSPPSWRDSWPSTRHSSTRSGASITAPGAC